MPIYKVKLIKKEKVAEGTMAFRFEKPHKFEFESGQFGDFTLLKPSETDEEGNTRRFSLTHDVPYENDLMIATRMRDTAFKRVIKELPFGSEVKFVANKKSMSLVDSLYGVTYAF